MAKVLIVGSSSALAQDFSRKAIQFFEVVTASSSKTADFKINFLDAQLPDISGSELTHAIIFSSATNIREIEENFAHAEALTLSGPTHLISKLNHFGVRCMVISTTAVFNEESIDTAEQSNPEPNSTYGQLKLELENFALSNSLNAVMRITKVFNNNSILKQWKDQLINGKEISCFEDLKVAPLPIALVSNALIKWIMESYHGISHVSPDKDMTYYQLGVKLATSLGINSEKVKGAKSGELIKYKPKKANLDCEGPYSYTHSLEDCISKAIEESI